MSLLALVDADIVTFQAAAANETTVTFDEGEGCLVADPDLAYFHCQDRIRDIKEKTGATHILMVFSGSNNFRYDALRTYKHNRKGKQKPTLLAPLRARLEAEMDCQSTPRLEADDLLGIIQSTSEAPTIICTIDKDLDQIAGPHYNWKNDSVYEVTERDALWFSWIQVLTGDATDGYKGIPRVGPAKATKILEPHRDDSISLERQKAIYNRVCWEAYEEKDIYWDAYVAQVAVAQILQGDQYDSKNNKVITHHRTY